MLFALVILITVFIISASTSVYIYAADNPLKITVGQIADTFSASADATFKYRIKPLDSSNPMPSGSSKDGYTFTLTGNDKLEIGLFDYKRQGIYSYEIFQLIETEKQGCTYDRRVYTAEAHVNEKLEVNIVVYNQDKTKTADIIFENIYKTMPIEPPDPTYPIYPIYPTYPIYPLDPTYPPNLTEPTYPLYPLNPTEPVISTELPKPIEPIEPLKPFKPAIITELTSPPEPAEPINPTDPPNQTEPAIPAISTDPTAQTDDPPKPANPGKENPKTGDDTNINLFITLFALGGGLTVCAAIFLMLFRKSRRMWRISIRLTVLITRKCRRRASVTRRIIISGRRSAKTIGRSFSGKRNGEKIRPI